MNAIGSSGTSERPDEPTSGPPGRARTADVLKTVAAALLTVAAGVATAYAATDGFQAYTLESARRLAALRDPRPVPEQRLEFSDGRRARLADLDAPVLLVDFLYTRCETFCVALGAVYARLQRELAPEIAAGRVRLVSVSFDPLRDGPDELSAYRDRHSPDPAGWDLARPATAGDLATLLSGFGVVVIPDGRGGFVHNAAVHIVGPDRRLVAILDMDDIGGITGVVRRLVASSTNVSAR